MTGATMIGRESELDVLRGAFGEGRSGRPRVVVVRGEAGIGKTRLLQEFLAEVDAASARAPHPHAVVALGQCVDIGEIGAPFTPIRRLLRELYRGVGDEAFRAAAGTPATLAILAALVPDLGAEAAPSALSGPEAVTDAVERVIEQLSVDHHLVLLVEDLHWADTATIALLRTLNITVRGTHLTILLTYRSDDVGRGHPLRPLLADLERNRTVTAVDVRRLAPEDTIRLARLTRSGLDDEAVRAIAARADGVPFFVEELVDLDGADLPETLRGLVLARYERLSESAAEVVGTVSAGGVHVDHDLLEEVYTGTATELRDGLREALTAGLLVADADGYTFRHALIQESVHGELLPSERAQLHRRYATTLEARVRSGATDRAAELAEHWLLARDIAKAFTALVAARTHAQQARAIVSAAQLGERLLELWPQVPDPEAVSGTREHVLATQTAAEWCDLSEPQRAIRILRAALGNGTGDAAGLALLHRQLAVALSNSSRVSESFAAVQTGLALLAGHDEPAAQTARARLLATALGYPDHIVGGADARTELRRAALASADETDDPGARSAAFRQAAWLDSDRGEYATALSWLTRAREAMTDPGEILSLILFETDTLLHMGRFADVIRVAEHGLDLAAGWGLDRGGGAMIATNLAEALFAHGETERGRQVASAAITRGASPLFRSFGLRLIASSRVWDGDPDAADAAIAGEAQLIADVRKEDAEEVAGWATVCAEASMCRFVSASDAEAARAHARVALNELARVDADELSDTIGIARRLLPVAAHVAAACAATGIDRDEASPAVHLVDAVSARLPDDAPTRAYRALVAAESASDGDGAQAWHAAVDALADAPIPIRYLHYARYRLAAALVDAGERAAALSLVEKLRTEAPRHGAALVSQWATALAVRAGMPLADAADDDPRGAAGAASVESTLTPRELQVLALVAEGLTNPEIGRRLFISPKTASVHVSAILAKIGARGRAEAAALYAARTAAPSPQSDDSETP